MSKPSAGVGVRSESLQLTEGLFSVPHIMARKLGTTDYH